MIRPKAFLTCARQVGLSATGSRRKMNLRGELREVFMYIALLRYQRYCAGGEGVKVVAIDHINI